MRLFIKILMPVFIARITNESIIGAITTFSHIQKEVTTFLSFNGETQKKVVGIIEDDLANCCQNEQNLVDYRNWTAGIKAIAAMRG